MRKIDKRALDLIAGTYGLDHQLEKLREELQEAADAIEDFEMTLSHDYSAKNKKFVDVLEEVGDVENMIYQFKSYFGEECSGKYKQIQRGKIIRQLKRIMEDSEVKDE